VPIAMTQEQQATERAAVGGGPALDEAVERLLAAGAAVNPFYSERTGVHVSNAPVVALLESVPGLPRESTAR
jgi:hypothetical protein